VSTSVDRNELSSKLELRQVDDRAIRKDGEVCESIRPAHIHRVGHDCRFAADAHRDGIKVKCAQGSVVRHNDMTGAVVTAPNALSDALAFAGGYCERLDS